MSLLSPLMNYSKVFGVKCKAAQRKWGTCTYVFGKHVGHFVLSAAWSWGVCRLSVNI